MAILWLTENYPPNRGGMAQSCDRIIHGLRREGQEIHVLHFSNRKRAFHTVQQEGGTYTACPVHESEPHTLQLCWNFLSALPFGIDKIVAFGGYLPMLGAPIYAAWLQKPLISLLRGNDFDAAVFMPKRRDILEKCLFASECVGVVSYDKLKRIALLYPDLNLRYTPNGIRLEDWHLLESEAKMAKAWRSENAKGKLVLGLFGHLKEKKGAGLLFQAIKRADIKDTIHLLIMGEPEAHFLDELQAEAFSYTLLPFLDRFELIKFYVSCDAVLLPSYYDGMPNVLLEAAALGIPVLGANIDGMKDVLAGNFEDWLFTPGNADEFARCLYNFVHCDPELIMLKARQLKDHIYQNFTPEKELEAYSQILK